MEKKKLSHDQITRNAIKAAVNQYNKFLKNKKEKWKIKL